MNKIEVENYNMILWTVNDYCPFKCWYCPETTWGGSKDTYSWEATDKFLDKLFDHFGKGYVEMSGGEPTQWPHIHKVARKFKENPNWNLGLITNLGKSVDFYKDLGVNNILASYHPNVIDTDIKRKIWFDKVYELKDYVLMSIALMMDPKHFEHCLDVLDMLYYPKLGNDRINIQTSRINDMENVQYQIGYTKQQEDIWKNISVGKAGKDSIRNDWGHDLKVTVDDTEVHEGPWEFHGWIRDTINKGDNNFKGWLCDTGMTGVHIAPNGNIFKGVCHGSYNMDSTIGNINKPEDIQWADKPMVCPYDMCFCGFDLAVNKKRI